MWRTWQRCWTHGRWHRLNDTMIHHHSQHRYYSGPVQMTDMDNFTWVTFDQGECACFPFYEFDREDFCRLLGGMDVFLIGDSLSDYFLDSMINMVRQRPPGVNTTNFPVHKPLRPIYPNITICEQWRPARIHILLNYVCGYIRMANEIKRKRISDVCLHPGGKPRLHRDGTPVCPNKRLPAVGSEGDRILGIDEFSEWARNHSITPGLIVINWGAHYKRDVDLLRRARRAIRWYSNAHPEALIVWRDTPVGHTNCSKITAPLTVPQDSYSLPLQWSHFPRQNRLVARMIEKEFANASVFYLDVANMTQYRGDLHVSQFFSPPSNADCLHYHRQAPNPIDHWVIGLYNLLHAVRSSGIITDNNNTPSSPTDRS